MFDRIVHDTAARFNLSSVSVSSLTRDLLMQMTNERTGGVAGFLDRLRRAGAADALASWFGGRRGRTIAPSQIVAALGPDAIERMAVSSHLTRSIVATVSAHLLPHVVGRLTPRGIMPSTATVRAQVAPFLNLPTPSSRVLLTDPPGAARPAVSDRRDWVWVFWTAAAALAIFALVWALRWPSGSVDAELRLIDRGGRLVYSGLVRDDTARQRIVDVLRVKYNGGADGDIRVDPNVRRAPWLASLSELLDAVQVPDVDLVLIGARTVSVGGWLSAAERQALIDRLRAVLGRSAVIGSLGDASTEAVRAANTRALAELRSLAASSVHAGALVPALNLAIVNFRPGSADLPADAAEIIDAAAAAIARAPAGSAIEIRGHTDNTGNPAGNLSLSLARAAAVKRALVAAGAPEAMLTTTGVGDAQPRAANDTEYGRFQNRRIEYAEGLPAPLLTSSRRRSAGRD